MEHQNDGAQAQLESVQASLAVPERLVEGVDAGGRRVYLKGRPVHCGTRLLLRLPGDRWTEVRLEHEGSRPVLYLYVGCQFERRFEVREDEGGYFLYDRLEASRVRLTDQLPPEEDGSTPPRWPELEADFWKWRMSAARAAREMNALYAGCEAVIIREFERCELRWPDDPVLAQETSPVQPP